MVTELMQIDLGKVVRTQSLTDQHIQFYVYQIVRALKVGWCISVEERRSLHRRTFPGLHLTCS